MLIWITSRWWLMPRLDGFPAGGLVVKHHQIPTRLRMGLYQINVFTFTIEFKYFSLDASVVVFTHCWCPLILESPCTCTLSKAGIPTALVNLISPFYMSMVRALLFSLPTFADLPSNNVANLPLFHFFLRFTISAFLTKSRALSMCNVPSCIGTLWA